MTACAGGTYYGLAPRCGMLVALVAAVLAGAGSYAALVVATGVLTPDELRGLPVVGKRFRQK